MLEFGLDIPLDMAEKTTYDLALSLGYSCGASQALRDAGLQFASFPLDWTGSPSVVRSAEIVASDFAHWLDREALELVDVRHGAGFNTRIYRNRVTGIGFSHEFGDFQTFEDSYPKVVETYERRIERMLELLGKSKRVLLVYLELPFGACASQGERNRAVRLLADRFPGTEFDLVYVYEDSAYELPKVVSSENGVTVVALDYRLLDHGEVTHFVRTDALAAFLRARFAVRDYRTEAERRKFVQKWEDAETCRWGRKSSFRALVNRWAFRLYRHLEKYLMARGLVQREGPLWFVEREGGAR